VCNPPGYTGQPEAPNSRDRLSPHQAYKLVKLEPDGTRRPLSNQEIKEFEKSHAGQCEWNSSRGGQKQWQKQCLAIIKKLRSQRKQAWAFNEPVDPVALNIPDYPDIIKHPMDLATLENTLVSGAIETPDQFVAQMRTIFRNCYVYNKPGQVDLVYESAEKLSLSFEKELLKM
jgi:hypothetical protein|tara:strand:- start:12 stop:530 length:519 start_codon:yes stop_codon:yes gene_type:complete